MIIIYFCNISHTMLYLLIMKDLAMNENVINYHKKRRPFIMIPETGIIFGEYGKPYAHSEILTKLGLSETQVKHLIDTCPRGYFLDNNLVLYQGDDVKEGENWELSPENFDKVRLFYPDLQKIFAINNQTRIFLGVKRGKIGDIWEKVNEVPLSFFA